MSDPNGRRLPPLVVPPHGRGRIYSGGVPGNKGGPGAPPSELRRRMRGTLAERLNIVEEIIADPEASRADKLRACDFLARYGLGLRHEIGGDDEAPVQVDVEALRRAILDRLPRHAEQPRDDVQLPIGD